ncbi:MAG: SRPBCC family protein [Candidatus Glassbacteria bacterium]
MRVQSRYRFKDNVHTVEAEVNILAPGREVWAILTDYEKLIDYIPGMMESKVIKRNKGRNAILEQEGSVTIFPFTFNSRIVLSVREKPMSRVSFEMLEGDFDYYEGFWSLSGTNGGVNLRLVIQASYPVRIPKFIIAHSLKSIARRSLSAIAEEAERRAGVA